MILKKLVLLFSSIGLWTGVLLGQGVDPGTQNLTHSWLFNDGTANDVMGGANGTLVGDPVIEDGSLLLYAAGQYMEMPADVIALNTYEEITLEAWFLSSGNEPANYYMLAYFGDTVDGAGANSYFMTPARGDDHSRAGITCGVTVNPWSGESGANGPECDDGYQHHFVSTLNATEITLYIDGVLAASTPLDATDSIAAISTRFAYLGKSGYDGDETWMGEISEFNIYNRALTADEVEFLYYKEPTTTVQKIEACPQAFSLLQNYPNPFNPVTAISFYLTERSKVNISIFNEQGCRIATLADDIRDRGFFSIPFDGSQLGSGSYFCRMQINEDRIFTRKMMLLK